MDGFQHLNWSRPPHFHLCLQFSSQGSLLHSLWPRHTCFIVNTGSHTVCSDSYYSSRLVPAVLLNPRSVCSRSFTHIKSLFCILSYESQHFSGLVLMYVTYVILHLMRNKTYTYLLLQLWLNTMESTVSVMFVTLIPREVDNNKIIRLAVLSIWQAMLIKQTLPGLRGFTG